MEPAGSSVVSSPAGGVSANPSAELVGESGRSRCLGMAVPLG